MPFPTSDLALSTWQNRCPEAEIAPQPLAQILDRVPVREARVRGIRRWEGHVRHRVLDLGREREFFVDNLMVRIHLIIVMILVDRPCAMGV